MRHTKMALAVLISNRKRVWRWCPKTTWNKNLKKNCPDLCHPQTGPYLIICLSAEHLSIRCDSHIIKKQRRYTQFTHWLREYVCVWGGCVRICTQHTHTVYSGCLFKWLLLEWWRTRCVTATTRSRFKVGTTAYTYIRISCIQQQQHTQYKRTRRHIRT